MEFEEGATEGKDVEVGGFGGPVVVEAGDEPVPEGGREEGHVAEEVEELRELLLALLHLHHLLLLLLLLLMLLLLQ